MKTFVVLVILLPFGCFAQYSICGCMSDSRYPDYPGGLIAFRRYIEKHLVYPPEAARQGLEGKVWLSFIVDTSLHIGQVTIHRSPGPDFDLAVLDALPMEQTWTISSCSPLRPVRIQVPIRFDLKEN